MNYTDEEINLITLCSFEELTYANRFALLSGFKSSAPDFDKHIKTLIKSADDGVYNKVKAKFYSPSYREKLLSKLEEKGVTCVTYFSTGYPEELKHIPQPPAVLFCKGDISLLKTRKFAVVGSRRTPPNIIKECKRAVADLTNHFTIVTGMADGADAAAAESALKHGKLISVLAYGFNHVYPSVNAKLIKKAEENGLLVTEYTPQVPPLKYNFPVRNRIMAGLADGVLVVSAPKNSGALITAKDALEYGKSIYAFPYTLGVECGEGCNALIKEGAGLFENSLDIFDDFGLDFKPPEQVSLTDEEAVIYNILKRSGEAFAGAVAEEAGIPAFKLIPVLTSLEIKGLVVRLGGNRYSAL